MKKHEASCPPQGGYGTYTTATEQAGFLLPYSKESKVPGCVWFSELDGVAGDDHGNEPCCKLP